MHNVFFAGVGATVLACHCFCPSMKFTMMRLHPGPALPQSQAATNENGAVTVTDMYEDYSSYLRPNSAKLVSAGRPKIADGATTEVSQCMRMTMMAPSAEGQRLILTVCK